MALIALGAVRPQSPPIFRRPGLQDAGDDAAIYDWSGFYVGLNAGGGSSHNCWDTTNVLGCSHLPAAAKAATMRPARLAGGQIGFRWQSGSWVFGVEAQGDWANLKGSNASIPVAALLGVPALTNQTKIDAIGLFTGQVGYAWNNVLFYVKGGGARHRRSLQRPRHRHQRRHRHRAAKPAGAARSAPASNSASRRTGRSASNTTICSWAAATSPSLCTGSAALTRIDHITQDVDIGTVRVNYRWGGPVIAKY